MTGKYEEWVESLPAQFHDGEYRLVAIKAVCRQLDALLEAIDEVTNNTDVGEAVGTNLDLVGEIVDLTRKEAGELLDPDIRGPVLSDDMYRSLMIYKMLHNTSWCTYDDLMKSINMLGDYGKVYYEEDPSLPATIMLTMPFMNPSGGTTPELGIYPIIKAAGIQIEYTYYIKVDIVVAPKVTEYTTEYPRCGTFKCGTWPYTATKPEIHEIDSVVEPEDIIKSYAARMCGTKKSGGEDYISTQGSVFTDSVETDPAVTTEKFSTGICGTFTCKK